MGGPWRDRGFDPRSQRPAPRVGARVEAARRVTELDSLRWIVLTYVAAVLTSFALMLVVMKQGW